MWDLINIPWSMLASAGVQVCLGIGLGMWISHRRSTSVKVDEKQAREFLDHMQSLTAQLADGLGQHSECIREISQELSTVGTLPEGASVAALVIQCAGRIVQANGAVETLLDTAEQQIRQQAQILNFHLAEARVDPLTRLANRRSFDEELARRFAEWRRTEDPFSLLLVDIDHFKQFNDEHGHQAGDQVLCDVGRALAATMREMDLVARYGGEEFIVLLPSTQLSDGAHAAERARRAIEQFACSYNGRKLRITASAGVAQAIASDNARSLIKRADEALYAAKHAGRNRGYMHDGSLALPIDALVHPATQPVVDLFEPSGGEQRHGQAERHGSDDAHQGPPGFDARTDALTGLPNRRAFSDELRRMSAVSRQQKRPLSLMLVAMDRLAELRAHHGQRAVDHVVRRVSQMLCAVVRDADLVTRSGWEEFAVILPGSGMAEVQAAQERIHRVLAGCQIPLEHVSNVVVYTGVAELEGVDDAVSLAKRAETSLQTARQDEATGTHLASAQPLGV